MDGQIIKSILIDTEVYEDCLTDDVKPILFKVFNTRSEKVLFKYLDALAALNKALYPAMRGTTSGVTLRRLEDNVENPVLRWKMVKGKTLEWDEAISELVAFYRSVFDKRQPFYKMFPDLWEEDAVLPPETNDNGEPMIEDVYKEEEAVEVEELETVVETVVEVEAVVKPVWFTPWRNIQGYECRITSYDYKDYSFHVGIPFNISISGFSSSVAANIAMRERVTALKALSSTEEEANKKLDNLIEIGKRSKKRGKKPEPVEEPTYTFTAAEDAVLVKVAAEEDW